MLNVKDVQLGTTTRKSFAKINEVMQMPNRYQDPPGSSPAPCGHLSGHRNGMEALIRLLPEFPQQQFLSPAKKPCFPVSGRFPVPNVMLLSPGTVSIPDALPAPKTAPQNIRP